MSVILLHAGMPKAGSSSIQRWLATHASELTTSRDVAIIVAKDCPEPDGRKAVHFRPWVTGAVNSGLFVRRYTALNRSARLVERFVDEVGGFAEQHSMVVISSEGFARPFYEVDTTFLSGLDELASRHEVRVCYYVRPQHTAIEAAWRQWGFRLGLSPSEYVVSYGETLHYFETVQEVRRVAPRISFEPRPFRTDLMHGGNPVTDFAHRFLDLSPDPDAAATWVNRGLPLDLVNALRDAPPELRGAGPHAHRELEVLQGLTQHWKLIESDNARRSRVHLQAHCRRVFESSNVRLASLLGWDVADFVPATSEPGAENGLSDLDVLWAPDASNAELQLLYNALLAALGATHSSPQG